MINVGKRIVAVGLASLAIGAVATPSAHAQETIRVGMYPVLPWGDDPADGICHDLMNAIGDHAGVAIEFVIGDATSLGGFLLDGTVDANCTGLGAGMSTRQRGYVFTGSYATGGTTLVALSSDTTPYTSDDYQGRRVGTIASIGGWITMLEEGGAAMPIPTYPTATAGLEAVVAGEIDAFLVADAAFGYGHDVRGLWPELESVETYVSPSDFHPAIAVVPGNTELLGLLQNALEELKRDGVVQEIAENWGVRAPLY